MKSALLLFALAAPAAALPCDSGPCLNDVFCHDIFDNTDYSCRASTQTHYVDTSNVPLRAPNGVFCFQVLPIEGLYYSGRNCQCIFSPADNLYEFTADTRNAGICETLPATTVFGCTNSAASNYDDTATVDDGSCSIADRCFNDNPCVQGSTCYDNRDNTDYVCGP